MFDTSIFEKLHDSDGTATESLGAKDVNAEQIFRLYLDRHLKYVSYRGNQYELNLIALDEEASKNHVYEQIKYDDQFGAFCELVEVFIKNTEKNKRSFLICDHKEYEVIMELMVSNE